MHKKIRLIHMLYTKDSLQIIRHAQNERDKKRYFVQMEIFLKAGVAIFMQTK